MQDLFTEDVPNPVKEEPVNKPKKKIMNKKVREGIIGYAFASL